MMSFLCVYVCVGVCVFAFIWSAPVQSKWYSVYVASRFSEPTCLSPQLKREEFKATVVFRSHSVLITTEKDVMLKKKNLDDQK